MFKPIAYFVIGIFTGLTISLLMKDAKPVNRPFMTNNVIRYHYPHYYRYGYDYYYRPLEYRGGGRRQSNTRNDEVVQSSGGNVEQGETHFNVRQVNDRKKN